MKKIKGITECKVTWRAETFGTEEELAEIDLEELKDALKRELINNMCLDNEEVVDYKIDIDFIFEEIEE
jgi:hypothetical protein